MIVSTDIGGTDPDDFQSMVHFLALCRHVRRRGPDLVAVRARAGGSTSSRSSTATQRDYPNLKTYSTGIPRPMRCGRSRSRGDRSAPGPAASGADGRLRLDRPMRAARRSAAAVRARLGRDRRSRAGAARRPRHPAEAPRLLHRRAEQDVERRRLQLHRAAASRRCGSSRPTRPIAAGSPAATRRASGATRHSWRRTSPAAARSAGSSRRSSRARSRWATARRSAICCTARRRSVAAGLGRAVRPHLGWAEDGLRSPDDRGRYGRSLRRRRVRAAGARRHDGARIRADDLRRPHPCAGARTTATCCDSASRRATRRCGRT